MSLARFRDFIQTPVLITSSGVYYILIRANNRIFRLASADPQILCSKVQITVSIELHPDNRGHTLILHDLLALAEHGCPATHAAQRLPHQQSQRYLEMLRSLDGFLAGESHRDIAVRVFGRARVDAEWSNPANIMKDTVRRRLRRGRTFMRGEYRSLLSKSRT